MEENNGKITQEENIEKLSQELFGKPSKDIKYLICTNYIHQQLLDEELSRTGLYQWINVFRGEIKLPRDVEDFNKYDIIQVNMSGQDVHLIGNIREALKDNKKTKLVVNNDYTTEMWQQAFEYPSLMKRELKNADMIVGTEYFQSTALSELSGRRVFIVPHPADVKRLKSLTPIPKKNIISTIWRRYDKFSLIPSLCVRNQGLTTQLIGYDKDLDPKSFATTTHYDYVYQGTNYMDFCNQLQESKIVFDPFTWHSYSRSTVDTAALGVAVVGSNRVQSAQVCYPYTCCDPYDVHKARLLIRKLIDDKEFYDLVVKTALERVEMYNHSNSKEKYLMSLVEALKAEEDKKEVETIKDKGTGIDVLKVIANEKNKKREDTK